MLNILQECAPSVGYNLRSLGPRSAEFWSILVQAKRLAYADLLRYNGDPRFVHVPVKKLTSKSYAASLCSQITPTHAPPPPLSTTASGDDSVSVPGYGFPMNDRGSFFNLKPSSPDVIAPHKRPFMTIIPAFVMKNGQPLLSLGNMGGDEQAQAQATEIVNMVDLGMNVQAAGDAARFHHSQDADEVDLESNLYALVGSQMKAMGYDVRKVAGDDDVFGGYLAILFQRAPGLKAPAEWDTKGDPPVNGVYHAASDFRKDGEAVGW